MIEKLEAFRLAPQQRQLWLAAPAGALPRTAAWVRVDGVLDAELLGRAVAALAERHEILRTVFRLQPGLSQPVQQVMPRAVEIERLDLRRRSAAEQRAELEERWADLCRPRPVVEDQGPGVVLARTGEGEATLLLSAPALGFDGTGLGLWMEALAAAVAGGCEPELPELQYGQFADWQNAVIEQLSEAAEAASAETEGATRLVLESGSAGMSWSSAERVTRRLVGDVPRRLARLSENLGVAAERVLLTVWKLLLERHGLGEGSPLIVGVDGRCFADELAAGLGRFTTGYALAGQLPAELRFRDAVLRLSLALDQQVEEGLPVDALLERSAGHADALPPSFVWRSVAGASAAVAGWQVERLHADDIAGRCRLEAVADDEALELILVHPPELLAGMMAERLLEQLTALLDRALADPERALGELEHRASSDLEEALTMASGGAARASAVPVYRRLAAWAERSPEAAALEIVGGDADGETLTYGVLASRIRRLARHLAARGVGREDRVAVLTGRSPELLVAALAILEAGAVYLPLDVDDPEERLAWILGDARPVLVLASRAQAPRVAAHGAPVWTVDLADLDDPADSDADLDVGRRPAELGPEQAAYVIYTSGSTGRPKGVVVSHGALSNYLAWCDKAYPTGPGRSVALHSPVSFDLVITSLFAPLAHGGTVALVAEDRAAGDPLAEALTRRGFDLLKLTPGHLRAVENLVPDARREQAANTLVLGGEPLVGEAVAGWRKSAPGLRVINEYGPTEATVGCLVHELAAGAPAAGPVAIGRPINGARVYSLDHRLRPCAAGAVGELHLAGAILARGYLGRPAGTAERFVPDPHTAEPGGRMYRTGDLAHVVPGVGWVHRGRKDEQLKIRGVRVEPGEVEAVLERHAAVRQAVVGSHGNRLAAWVVRSTEVDSERLEKHARRKLPPALVPSLWSFVDALPLAASGKVDRRSLPEPRARQAEGGRYRPPETAAEIALAEIWREILDLERIGVDQNFFEVGGDSITSAQVVYRARQAGLELSVRQLVKHPTLDALAAAARPVAASDGADESPYGSVPATPIQRWFFDLELTRRDHWNQALWLASDDAVDGDAVRRALERLRRRHPMLTARFVEVDSGWRQEVAESERPLPFEVHDLSGLTPEAGQRARVEAAERLQRSLDLAAGRLLAAAAFEGGEDEPWRLLLVIHHLVVDGVSWRLLLHDLARELTSDAAPNDAEVRPQGPSYRLWAERLTGHARATATRAELDFWCAQQLGDDERLPRDLDAGAMVESSSATLLERLAPAPTRDLLERAPAAYRTGVEDLLITALVTALVRFRGDRNGLGGTVLELEGHGREPIFEDLDPSHTVGWFTSLYPLRLELGRRRDPGERLKAIKEQMRAVPQRGVGFGLLRYLGRPEDRSLLAGLVAPEVGFNYLGRLDRQAAGPFQVLSEPVGAPRDGDGVRRQLLTVTAGVANGRLEVTWTYSRRRHEPGTMKRLAAEFLNELRLLIEHCVSEEAGGATPPDFPDAGLDQGNLDDFLFEMGAAE